MVESIIKQPRVYTGHRDCLKITLAPTISILRRKLFRLNSANVESIAEKEWQISPGIKTLSRPAYFLPDQLERVTGTAYTNNPLRDMTGGIEVFQTPTRGFLLKDAWLVNRTIYKNNYSYRMNEQTSFIPQIRVENEIDRGAVYGTFDGNEFFGL